MNEHEEIKTLYEDDHMLAINKPAGVTVHPDGKTKGPFLTDWIVEKYPDTFRGEGVLLDDGSVIERPGIVHRLDKETSGVLLIAKTEEAFLDLKEQFMGHEVQKTYHAFVEGIIRDERGVIDKAIGRSPRDARKRTTERAARMPKEAYTSFKVLERREEEKVTFVEVWPKTGRTHQIRVHFRSIGRPVICDGLYGKRENSLGFKRLALHARSISFKTLDGKKKSIEASYPEDFAKAIKG